ncbi:hypothetical protein DFH06DRAFT_1340987 [Mycena polygramma]|nr:hypothetical protein DFH06DRAFT_1340987 [Mycena polygramma]
MLPEEVQKFNEQLGRVLRRSYRVFPAPPVVGEVITGDPVLPPELEREIFELAAAVPNYWTKQHVGDMALVLPQVCRRAQSWIEPLIYERISLPPPSNSARRLAMFLETVDTRPASFFATHVKYLDFDGTISLVVVKEVLSVCTGVVNLGCRYTYCSLAPLLAPLPRLRRLLVAELMLSYYSMPTADWPFSSPPLSSTAGIKIPPCPCPTPWAASLTHLGLSRALPPDLAGLFAAFPALTHFAVDFDAVRSFMAHTLLGLLSACPPRVRCIVVLARGKADYRAACRDVRDNIVDARLYVHLGGWQTWSRRVPDMFTEADTKIAKLSQ